MHLFRSRGAMVHFASLNAPYTRDLAFRPVITAWDAFRFSLVGPQRIGGAP
jgi:hypothetical protein